MKKHLLFLSLLLIGCGSIEKLKTSKYKKKETDTETKSGSQTNTTAFKDSFSAEPYDNTKPMIIGRDTIYNTRIINNKEIVHTQKNDTIYIKAKGAEEVKEDIKHKESDNTTLFIWLGLGAFLTIIISLFLMMWFFNKKISSVISLIPKNNVL